jgi:hypothetical protein
MCKKIRNVVICTCGKPVVLEDEENLCDCGAVYNRNGVMTEQPKDPEDYRERDRRQIEDGWDNLWDPETEKIYEELRA